MPNKYKIVIILIVSCFFICSCRTYYQRNIQFNEDFEQGRFEEALKVLDKDKKAERRKTRLLYFMNKGTVASLKGDYMLSNEYFEKAYITIEDQVKNPLDIAASLLTNPNMVEYRGEDFERLLIHYYKALNFLKLNNKEAALVECRRMDIKLQQLKDKYNSDNRYKKDAFMHLLMGLIYDSNYDFNNAFIAYRNAYEVYLDEYPKMFGTIAPMQLKKDLLHTAYKSGLHEELARYEKEFGFSYQKGERGNGNLVFFWQNGLGPVKEEWGIDFVIVRGQGGIVHFRNEELGLNFSFPMSDDEYKSKGLADLEFIRVAFPKYLERPVLFNQATIKYKDSEKSLELAEDINAIAFKSLEQRMLEELGKSLLRVALKKAAEYQLRKKDEGLGAALGALNAISEKADTRNWQSVPHGISYTRISLPEGKQDLKFITEASGSFSSKREHNFTYEIKKGETLFTSYQSLEFGR